MPSTEDAAAPQPTDMPPQTAPQPHGMSPVAAPSPQERPLGVTLIGVLYALGTAALLLGALLFIVGGSVFAGLFLGLIPGIGGKLGALGGALFVVVGLVIAAFGVLFLLITMGFFKGRAWAWTTVLILEAVSLGAEVLSLIDGDYSALIGMAIAGLMIWYLFEPAPKAFFGKSHVRAFWQKEQAPAA